MGENPSPHIPVMVSELLALLEPRPDRTYLDATLGDGGHARAFLEAGARVVGLDWDDEALERARRSLASYERRLICERSNFSELSLILKNLGMATVDGIFFDLGVSTLQLESAERGFSFQREGPLDMRMDRRIETTAESLVSRLDERGLADILWKYGGERRARWIAKKIVRARERVPFRTTRDLAGLFQGSLRGGIHPATRVFQALRMAVNRELDNLETALPQALEALVPGGRMAVLSYHSLEDGRVKSFFRGAAEAGRGRILTPKPLRPSTAEVQNNPRARSAKLRAFERGAPPSASSGR